MSIYDYSKVKREISGFGGGYEQDCRNMVIAGLTWYDKHPNSKLSYSEHKNIYGITTNESADMKKCQKAMCKAVPNCSGAMMQASMEHLMYIIKNGWDKYAETMNKEEEQNNED